MKIGVGGIPDCFGCPVPHVCEKIRDMDVTVITIERDTAGTDRLASRRRATASPPFLFW
jgi:hypothetical protein